MKKFLLFVSSVFLSMLFINYNVNAQELPDIVMKVPRLEDSFFHIQTNENTYEFYADYVIVGVHIDSIEENEYFMVFDMFERFKKGLDRRTNSYVISQVIPRGTSLDPWTQIEIRMTVLKSIIDEYGGLYLDNIDQFLNEVPTLYIKYHPLPDSIDYHAGYNDGYSNGYNDGFQVGDENGYNRGYNDGYDDGFDYGRDLGNREGYYDGYNDGYEQG